MLSALHTWAADSLQMCMLCSVAGWTSLLWVVEWSASILQRVKCDCLRYMYNSWLSNYISVASHWACYTTVADMSAAASACTPEDPAL